ncbi:hypothetical protein B0H14DRAFT_2697694 [Mycena olivaceomarginata]|nr:hypothetical protein B0H14DRAFT_2697694 [Mycena olivaceomarginata]
MAGSPDEATRLNDQATKLFEEGKFQDAGELYERANKIDSTNSPIYLANLALVELRLKQYQKAEISATQALLRDPRDLKARFRRAYFPGYLTPMLLLRADYPSAYGSPGAPRPRNAQTVSCCACTEGPQRWNLRGV